MKDTIRLSRTNKNNLEVFADDGNVAISNVLGKYAQALMKIASLEKTIETLQKATSVSQKATSPVAQCNGWKPDPAFWAQFRDEVRAANHPCKPPNEFVQASTLKTIGKIDPSEKLEEPIGRQGRKL